MCAAGRATLRRRAELEASVRINIDEFRQALMPVTTERARHGRSIVTSPPSGREAARRDRITLEALLVERRA